MKKLASILLAAVTVISSAALLSGCKGTEYPVDIANYTIDKEPENVVVLDAATADILSYMGYDRKFAGRSDAVDQEELSAAPSVGTASNPNVDEIISLGAEIVFSGEELTEGSKQKLEEEGIKVIKIQQAQSSAEVETNYLTIGKILGGNITGEKEGRDAYDRLLNELDAQKKDIEGLNGTGALKTICYLYLEDGKLRQITSGNYGNILMGYTNCINVAVNSEQANVDTLTLAGANPNYIFYSDEETLNFINSDANLSKLEAVKSNKLYMIPLKNMSRQGFTAVKTLKEMIDFIYNENAATPAQAEQTTQATSQPETTQPATKADDKTAETTKPAESAAESVVDKYKVKLDKLELKKDMENDNVKAMQQRLYDLGYVTDKDNITGYFGSVTEQAVKDFQKASGLSVSGTADNKTLTALFMSDAKKAEKAD